MKTMNHFAQQFKASKQKAILVLLFAVAFFCNTNSVEAQTLTLKGTVWMDLNNNGKFDNSFEWTPSGIQVRLYQDFNDDGIADVGAPVISKTTNSSGVYSFSGLAQGNYFVKILGSYYYKSMVYGGDPDNNIDSDNNGFVQDPTTLDVTGQTITLAPGTEPDGTGATNTNTNTTYDFGIWKGNGLGDRVWLDNNKDGLQDAGEPGIPGVLINLRSSTGSLLATTISDLNGMYYFYDAIQYGTTDYQLEFITPASLLPCIAKKGTNDEFDSDAIGGWIKNISVPQGTWNNNLDAGFMPANILPVKFTLFDATLKGDKVELVWNTADESNLSHFVIERSSNGKEFNEAGLVFTSENTSSSNRYTFGDTYKSLNAKYIYYRIRSVDNDGKAQYSEVRIVKVDEKESNQLKIAAFPNPVINELRITMPDSWRNKKATIEIYSASGNRVIMSNSSNTSQVETISVAQLSHGVYILKVSCNGESLKQQIIKQ